ncbi:MAG TPA: methyltransferase domain-containing protein [Longimicrobiales bacterium]|nr:methyltransferase domain-containing protein [Longimicrobiales bacterium]
MRLAGIDLVCPACGGGLASRGSRGDDGVAADIADDGEISCTACGRTYPMVLGIPDLRLWSDPYISMDEDRAKARMLAERCAGLGFAESLEVYYSITTAVPPFQARRFVRALLAADGRSRDWLDNMDARSEPYNGDLLDVGCGTAPLLVAAAPRFARVCGVDVAMRWLIMARKRLDEAGVAAPLVCACAEALPFPRESFACVTADSTLEHLRDQSAGSREIHRVLCAGGRVYVATPNRRSLGPDPHTGLPAGGWLPDSLTAAYVRRKGGIPPLRRLLTERALRSLLAGAGFERITVEPYRVSAVQRASFGPATRAAIDAYMVVRKLPGGSGVLRAIGPLLNATAYKPAHRLPVSPPVVE